MARKKYTPEQVDQILGHWLLANGYEEISLQCENKSACYQWQGTWVGRYPTGKK
ncbi:hypothetical protein [Bdellovibrio bacteriovorus]|uniref:hypothetical protein n=1 Tax=Bdellovibrio bacteriovorus TaxID=959 RepID=UPI000AB6779C|nr:hypothetical protein [Bdellovibrio bacteriovorus]